MSNPFSSGHVLLYHGIFKDIPSGLESRIHNVVPDNFRQQIMWLRENFDIVTIDDFAAASTRRGLAVITFDDAYSSVFSDALPWLIDEAIPATVFLNSSLLEGEIFWRDKIRYLITHQLVGSFLSYCSGMPWVSKVRQERFYKDSKKPGLNSQIVSEAVDSYLRDKGLTEIVSTQLGQVIATKDKLISHPLITYGNHTHSHFVLSSLTEEEQREEIGRCQSWLMESGLGLSRVLAAPFGGTSDVNTTTEKILTELGISALAMSRKAINSPYKREASAELDVLERYMAPSTLERFQELAALLDQE
ncbi:polysaccharide deacetylase family protein [Kiloniella sp.]|uniref:polysaccharide deacetylase family protein n=1 Tax=Kiloniella sp. TaxID=1938587 RepID=UPI003B01EA85